MTRFNLPAGTGAIAVGLVANGAFTYAFLAIASWRLADASYDAIAVVWGLVALIGAGAFQPLEQELARSTSERAAVGDGSRPVMLKSLYVGAAVVLLVGVLAVAAWFVGLDAMLDHQTGLLVTMVLTRVAFMFTEVVRGVAAGRRRFGAYGVSLFFEGSTRLAGALLLLVLGVRGVVAFGAVMAASFGLAAVGGTVGARPFAEPGSGATSRELLPRWGQLLVMAMAEAFLLNIGPVAVGVLSDEAGDPGRFLNALVIARLPLFLFQAVKIALLPSHVALAAEAKFVEMRQSTRTLLLIVGSFGLAVAVGSALLGPWIVNLLFTDHVGRSDMLLLGASTAFAMVTVVLSLTLLSVGNALDAVCCWLVGVAVFVGAALFPIDAFMRVEIGLVLGFVAAAALMGWRTNVAFVRLSR